VGETTENNFLHLRAGKGSGLWSWCDRMVLGSRATALRLFSWLMCTGKCQF